MRYLIANFKSHKTQSEITAWLKSYHQETPSDTEVILALPFPYLSTTHNLPLAAQDVSPFPPGSYTGAVNAHQLKDLAVKYCLIGHSERRLYFHETPLEISRKASELVSVGITPVICLSEADLAPQFATLDDTIISHSLFAFETLSDIGKTDTTPTAEITRVISLLRNYTRGSSLGLLYGGSVNKDNIASLTNLVDGVLVATASLDPVSFSAVVQGFTTHA